MKFEKTKKNTGWAEIYIYFIFDANTSTIQVGKKLSKLKTSNECKNAILNFFGNLFLIFRLFSRKVALLM